MNKFKIGTLVYCRSYICKSGNMFHYIKPEESQDGIPKCTLWNEYPHEYEEEVEDYMETDRYKKIEKCFKGIYVGTTSLCTKIFCSYDTWLDRDYFRFGKKAPKQFAVVYYADNKKRLVPLDDLKICDSKDGEQNASKI